MDYGPFISTAIDLGGGEVPVNKGIVVRLRTPQGTPTDLHAVFDTYLLSWRLVWDGELELRGIVYDGPHGIYPRAKGTTLVRAPPLPGAAPRAADLDTDPRDEPWGPIPQHLGRWSGLHLDGNDLVFDYTIGSHRVLERVWAEGDIFVREITTETAHDSSRRPVFAMPSAASGVVVKLVGDVERSDDGASFNPPANGKCFVLVAPRGSIAEAFVARPSIDVHAAIARLRPRWSQTLITRGVIDATLDATQDERRIDHPAGSNRASFDIASGGTLEIIHADASPLRAPALEAIVVRTPAHMGAIELKVEEHIGWWQSDTGHGQFELNAFTGENDLRLDGVTWRRGVTGRSLDFDGTAGAWLDEGNIDLGVHDLTAAAWIHTTSDGSIFAISPLEGEWVKDGATVFLRGGRLNFDVGW
ncbi:MAG: DUF6797 domain-containing protein, partial [Pseudomonadales bacterium]